MKRFLIIIFIFNLIFIFSQDNSEDIAVFSDNDYLNIDIDDIINNSNEKNKTENNKKITKNDVESQITFTLSVKGGDETEFMILRNNLLNDNNRFAINTFSNKTYSDIQANINFAKIFQIYIDNSFRFIYESNDIAHIKTDEHKNIYNKRLENIVKEFYFLWNIPIKYPIKIVFGRTFFNPDLSFTFQTFNVFNYQKKNIGGFVDSDDVGVNMLKFSAYFPIVSFDLIYSPGIPDESDVTKMFNIQKEQKFATKIDFNLRKVNFNINGFIDTNLKWALGANISVNVTDEIILYSDIALKGKEKKYKITKNDEKLYGDMNKYEIVSTEKMVDFSGVLLGINYTPKSVITIYGELYFNTNGFLPDEQKNFFDNINDMNKNFHNPEYPEFLPNGKDIRTNFKYYYLGKLGESFKIYDIFNLGAFYFFTQIGKDDIAKTGIDLSLSAFIHLFDGSTMLIPKIRYNFLKYFSFEMNSTLFLGYEKSLIGEVPYFGTFKILLEVRL